MNHIVREPDKLAAASTIEHRQAQPNHVPADPSRLAPPHPPAQQNILNPSAMSAHLVSQQNPQPFDPTSFLPQHFMQEFLRLSTPVGQNPDDDAVLVRALHDSRQNGKTYKQALEGLHGINNHAANLWKDYYLDHHDRIEMLVSRLNQQPKTVKKPFTTIPAVQERSGQKRKLSPTLASDRSSPKLRGRTPKLSQSKRFSHTPPAQTTTTIRPPKRLRATMNSLSADPVPTANTMVRGLTPPHADIPIPDPPSRSPTPPTKIHIGTHGNRYTPEDRDYFIKFITWRLKHDPSYHKKGTVPHHSSTSWASHWHTRHDLADKILAAYQRGVDTESRATKHHSPPLGDPWPYCSDQDADTEDDEADMGEPGTPFTRGDWCMFARFMARVDWDEMVPKERFDTFAESHDTERSAKSWAEFYRKNQDALLKLSKRYSKQDEDSEDIHNRRARPSWAQRCSVSDKSPSDEDGDYEIDEGVN
ncbi:hypothetical protein EDD17DRAFT_1579788 [Pisolithus thermaeus]|nr:hypothetical protein EDD17DRAFT_1579788 [Pisolithus thermaeus]